MIIMTEDGMFDLIPGAFFTQAELQQLKVILSERITMYESLLNSRIFLARRYKSCGQKENATLLYKEADKVSKRIATLAKLQYKIKYKLLTVD